MAKKHKRSVTEVAKNVPNRPVMDEKQVEKKPSAGLSSTRLVAGSEFNPDYSYVIKDLKRIAILAATFFVAIIVLSYAL